MEDGMLPESIHEYPGHVRAGPSTAVSVLVVWLPLHVFQHYQKWFTIGFIHV